MAMASRVLVLLVAAVASVSAAVTPGYVADSSFTVPWSKVANGGSVLEMSVRRAPDVHEYMLTFAAFPRPVILEASRGSAPNAASTRMLDQQPDFHHQRIAAAVMCFDSKSFHIEGSEDYVATKLPKRCGVSQLLVISSTGTFTQVWDSLYPILLVTHSSNHRNFHSGKAADWSRHWTGYFHICGHDWSGHLVWNLPKSCSMLQGCSKQQ